MRPRDSERALLLDAGMPSDARILQLACGEGNDLRLLGAARGSAGVDVASAKLRAARDLLPHVSFVLASGAALPFADGAFEAVLIRDALRAAPDRQAVVNEAARVLAPGGVLVVLESSSLRARASSRQLARELLFAGLDDLSLSREQPLPRAFEVLGRGASRLAERLVPARLWGVLVARGRRLPRAK